MEKKKKNSLREAIHVAALDQEKAKLRDEVIALPDELKVGMIAYLEIEQDIYFQKRKLKLTNDDDAKRFMAFKIAHICLCEIIKDN